MEKIENLKDKYSDLNQHFVEQINEIVLQNVDKLNKSLKEKDTLYYLFDVEIYRIEELEIQEFIIDKNEVSVSVQSDGEIWSVSIDSKFMIDQLYGLLLTIEEILS